MGLGLGLGLGLACLHLRVVLRPVAQRRQLLLCHAVVAEERVPVCEGV